MCKLWCNLLLMFCKCSSIDWTIALYMKAMDGLSVQPIIWNQTIMFSSTFQASEYLKVFKKISSKGPGPGWQHPCWCWGWWGTAWLLWLWKLPGINDMKIKTTLFIPYNCSFSRIIQGHRCIAVAPVTVIITQGKEEPSRVISTWYFPWSSAILL